MEPSVSVKETRGCQKSHALTKSKVSRNFNVDADTDTDICECGHAKSDNNFLNGTNGYTQGSINPMLIPEIASHFLMFVQLSDLMSCRLTCTTWKVFGAMEIVRRCTFNFTESNLYNIDSFQNLMNSTLNKPIRLKISLTQFGFCRHHEQLCNILFMYGARVTTFTLAFVERELNVELDVLRSKLNQNEHVMRTATVNFTVASSLVTLIHADTLELLRVLNHFNFNAGVSQTVLMSYQKRLEPCVKNYFMELVLMIPNLKSVRLYSYYGICCNFLLEVLAIAKPINLRHLIIESPSLIWDSLCAILDGASSSFDLDTLSLEHVSIFIRRMNLSSKIGNSRLFTANSLHLRLSSHGYRTNSHHYHDFKKIHVLESTISRYERENSKENRNGEPGHVNCIGLLRALNESSEL